MFFFSSTDWCKSACSPCGLILGSKVALSHLRCCKFKIIVTPQARESNFLKILALVLVSAHIAAFAGPGLRDPVMD